MNDVRLIARVASGDERALGELYDSYAPRVFAFAADLVGGDDAEDVVTQVFTQLWRSAGDYDAARGSVGAWIVMMTRARALDLLRSRKRRANRLAASAAAAAAADDDDHEGLSLPMGTVGPAPDAHAELAEERSLVAEALAQLSGAQRKAIELAFFGGLSHSEVAAELGEPLGTVKTRIRSALENLRTRLHPLLADQPELGR